MSMEWKTINHRSGNIEYCYIGKIAVASVQWDFGQTKGTNLTHRAVVNLPHLKNNFQTLLTRVKNQQKNMLND